MTAKEMFEKLGFEKSNYWDKDIISYFSINNDVSIKFFNKFVHIYCGQDSHAILCETVIRAINKQMEELGW